MSFSQFTWKIAVGCSFAVAVPAVVSGQSSYAPQGIEYPLAGALPGDQVMPHAAVNAGGGFVVWQDQNTFGDRFTIMGKALDSDLNGVFAPFRVNSSAKGDHENARVALLNDGGAVFVWQGGLYGFQHIYARFLSPSNTWLVLDQMVNASVKIYQANPAVAVLNNGNVIIVYASYNTNTMQDVYGQIFSPTGQKIGGEFQLNQFTSYNQRTPTVAALNNGGFVAGWVSEQQRNIGSAPAQSSTASLLSSTLPSVDIYARLFDASGSAGVAEFLVNDSVNVCANPVVAAASDGSVMFAWSEKDAQVRNNGWDVYARPFTFSGSVPLAGVEQRVNTQLYGDQYAPRISAQGTNHLVAWTSLGQDGSAAGVYGQVLNADGSRSGGEFRVNSATLGAQQEPVVAADGSGRFLTVWTSPTYGSSKNDLFAQICAGGNFTPPAYATNYASPAFVGDTSSGGGSSGGGGGSGLPYPYVAPPTLGYPGEISSGGSVIPATNAFALAAGTYNGLFYNLNGVSPASAGSVSVKVNKDKTFSGSVSIGGKSYPLGSPKANLFDPSGATTASVSRPGLSSLTVSLQLDLSGGNQIRGTVKSGNEWSATLFADHQIASVSPYAGTHTFVVPAGQGGPPGSGYVTVTIKTTGISAAVCLLADGTSKITLPAPTLSKTGIWPLYYNANGEFLMSWIQFNVNPPGNDSGGDVVWIKPALKSAKFYPAGFTNEVPATAALNVSPAQGTRQLHLSYGGLSQAADFSVQIGPNNKVTNLSANKLSLSVSSSTGVFKGSAAVPGAGKTISFQGALLKGGEGEGFFMNGSQSGQVKLDQP
jgi:hypothetical protein